MGLIGVDAGIVDAVADVPARVNGRVAVVYAPFSALLLP
jgi:hypothetical protein